MRRSSFIRQASHFVLSREGGGFPLFGGSLEHGESSMAPMSKALFLIPQALSLGGCS